MQQIADWLNKLGLSEYADRFVENDIDVSVLAYLTDQDLKELGVSLGHRRKMLAAIAALAGGNGSPSPQTVSSERKPQDTAERRQVTVMFCDLVGSTALSARLDPEDLREVIAAYHRCTTEIVRRFGGFVSQYLGDGVLVYFGYPQAHEDDAERAVRAALELIAAVAKLNTRVSLQARVGIATGVVVVGDVVDAGGSQERGIVGETPNLAARLQGLAQPGMVVIAESTRKLLGNLFDLADLGESEVKGIAGPLRAWAALRASSVESRFEALRSRRTSLVGRDEEVELLLRRWKQAKAGDGKIVLISAEAGIGKSRLTEALEECIALEPHRAAGGDAARRVASAMPGQRTAVPATLQASLLARLDRLGSAARELAQTGAAIGREFSYDVVSAVTERPAADVAAALDRLVDSGLVFVRGTPPAADYQFKHALVQDTAYGTLSRGPRQVLHGRIAAAMENRASERAERWAVASRWLRCCPKAPRQRAWSWRCSSRSDRR
jgi:class 3 adenylate cyclase